MADNESSTSNYVALNNDYVFYRHRSGEYELLEYVHGSTHQEESL